MTRNNADYWNKQAVREYGGMAFAVLFFVATVVMAFL